MNRRLLKRIAVLKVSESELPFISAGEHSLKKLKKLGPGIVLLTRGARGLTLWSEREGMFRIPAFETEVKDPTGAGDALAGAFLVTLARTGDLFWSASVGTALASFLVARTRALGFGTRRQIQRRALRIVDSISRM
jgi:sugar/nucleoside kinase (ribokinase family)